MVELLIVADDFTGALDTGVQLAKKGIETLVTIPASLNAPVPEGVRVISMDIETRHMSPSKAYDSVFSAAAYAIEQRIEHVYKKIDSTLRGNIGAELSALIDAYNGRPVALIPAYPTAGRTTVGGYQLVNGVHLNKTQFASDILNPVTDSYIPHIISASCDKRVVLANTTSVMAEEKDTIYVLDTETEAQLADIGKSLKANGFSGLLSGCAGFAEYLPAFLDIRPDMDQDKVTVDKGNMLIVCGSVNYVSTEQCKYAFEQGVPGVMLTSGQKITNGYWDSQEGENDIADYARQCKSAGAFIIGCGTNSAQSGVPALPTGITGGFIAGQISMAVEKLMTKADVSVLVIFGGDTAAAIMNRLGVSGIIPVTELLPGIVLSRFTICSKPMCMVTKAGGFGSPDTIVKIVEHMNAAMNAADDRLADQKIKRGW